MKNEIEFRKSRNAFTVEACKGNAGYHRDRRAPRGGAVNKFRGYLADADQDSDTDTVDGGQS